MLKNKNKNKNPISFVYLNSHTFTKNMQEENNTHALQKPPEILLKFRD